MKRYFTGIIMIFCFFSGPISLGLALYNYDHKNLDNSTNNCNISSRSHLEHDSPATTESRSKSGHIQLPNKTNMLLSRSSDDTFAFQQSKLSAAPSQTIHLPAGNMKITGWPDTSSKLNFWELDGTTQGGSLITSIGTDPILTHTGGGSWFFARATPLNADPVVRVDRYETATGGSAGVHSGLQRNCVLPNGEVDYYEWCNQTILTINSHGSGQHVGDAINVIRTDTSGSTTGEMWADYRAVTDNTGLEGDKSAAAIASELNTNVNGKVYGGGRGVLAAQMAAGLSSGYAPEADFAIRTNAFNNGYFDSTLLLTGMYRDTAIDTTKAAPLSVNETLTSAAAVGATTLSVNTTHNGIFVGQYVTGSGISPGTTVLSITDTSVTLSKGLVTAMATNSALVFCSDSPVFSMNPGQFLQYGDRNHRVVFGGDINDDGSVDTSKGNTVAISTWSAPGSLKFYEMTAGNHYLDMGITHDRASFAGILTSQQGVALPNMTRAQILAIPNPVNGQMVNDTDANVPVIEENGHWYPMTLGVALQ